MPIINLDITNRCTLECPHCLRASYKGLGMKVPGRDMTISEYKKIIDKFDVVRFCGNSSDPVFNPNFIEFLRMSYEKNIKCKIHNAATGKSAKWYKEAFEANPDATWFFAIDGLPENSHIYRKNQKAQQLFDMMKMCKDMGLDSVWLYLIFYYNEDNMDEAQKLADDNGIPIYFLKTTTHTENNWPTPKNKNNYIESYLDKKTLS